MLLFAFIGTMKAGVEVEVGTAASTNSYLPTYTYYNYSLTQQIYTAEEIGMGGIINSISFQMASGDDRTRVINLFMKNVTRSTFEITSGTSSSNAWELFNETDALFSGEVTFTQGWVTITLGTPFMYNGNDNLLVCVQDATGSYLSAPSFSVFNSTGSALRVYRDGGIYPIDNPDVNGTVLNVKNYIKMDMDLLPANIVATPSSIDMGMRPNGAWMAPMTFTLANTGGNAIVSALTSSDNYFTLGTEAPFTLATGESVEVEVATGNGVTGSHDGNITVTYTDDRSATLIPITATAYNPLDGDVWENAIEVNTFPYTGNAPAGIYHNYELPDGNADAVDAVYKVTFEEDVMLSAITAGANGNSAIYAEDFNGEGGPGADNTLGSGANVTPINVWFNYDYNGDSIGTNTFFGTSSGGGFMWGYKVAPEYLAGYGQCYLTQVESAAREAYAYDLYVLRGGDTPADAELIYSQEMGEAATALSYFIIDVTAPFEVGEEENLWVILYSESPFAAYCGKVPVDPANAKVWYTLNGTTWSSNENLTPEIFLHLEYPYLGGRSVVMNLADMNSLSFSNGTVGEKAGVVKNATMHRNQLVPKHRNRGEQVSDMFVPAGSYYVAMASTDPEFSVSITTAEPPLPEQATIISPADGELGVDNGDLMQWAFGDYTSEFQILFGTIWPPTDILVDWTNYLYESMELTELQHNKTYFVQINARNSVGTTYGEITGFTTMIDGVEGFAVESENLYPGDAAVFTWEPAARSHKGYNLYQDGVKVNETPITGTTYSVEGLEYNMTGYEFQLAALYDEGESELTDPITVYMTGIGTINGHVWEIDSITPVYNAVIQLIGLDEYGVEQAITLPGATNPSGYFEGEALAGNFQAIAIKEGYQANPSEEFVMTYNTLTPDVNIYALEDWATLGTIRATEEEDDVLVEWSWDPAELIVDFETGDFSQAEFTLPATHPWAITTSNPHEGTYCMKSTCEGVASGSSTIEVTLEVPYDGKMGFWVMVSSEANWDKFHFYIDGTEQGQALSGALPYSYKEFAVTEGTHTYKWEYTKDSSVNSNDDCVYVDDITMYRQDIPVPPTPGAQTYDFEDGTLMGWTLIDADGDGFDWVANSSFGGHNGSMGIVYSQSYDNNYGPLTPDNYLVAPTQITAHNGAAISFWACAQDASWAAEHFGVAVSTTNNSSASAFTTIQEWTMTAKGPQGTTVDREHDIRGTNDQGTWYEFTADLSSYAGQNIWVALRHFNSTDYFYIDVDDITISDGGAKRGGVRNDRQLSKFYLYRRNNVGDTLVEQIATPSTDVFSYIDAQWPNLPYGEYQWGIQAYYQGNHHYPEKGRETINFDFEGGLQGWTVLTVNSDGGYWLHSDNNPGGYDYTTHAHGGTGFAMCYSYVDYVGSFNTDSYLISPQKYDIVDGSSLSFWADNANDTYPESFSVCVATVDNPTASDFTQIWTGSAKGSKGNAIVRHNANRYDNWRSHEIDLSSYAGQSIYIAFHDACEDQYEIWIDDVTITSDGSSGGGGGGGGGGGSTTSGSLTIDFETGDFSQYDFDNTVSSYPWDVVAGGNSGSAYCMKSTNGGVASSESAIEATVEYVADGTVSFDANCQGEGTSTIWDKCRFFIDGAEQFSYGANNPGWNHFEYNVTAGSHIFRWSYTKDGSVNPTGDCMSVDNIVFDGLAGGGGPGGETGFGYSEILWSNIIDKDMEADVTFNISLNNAQSPAGATVEMAGLQTYQATIDETATHTFEAVRKGNYAIEVVLPGYAIYNDTVMIEADATFNITLEEIIDPVDSLYVSPTGWAMWQNTTATTGTTTNTGGGGGTGGGGTGGGGGGGGGGGTGSGDTFTVDFESGLPTGWTVIDANNDGWTWCLTSAIPTTWTYYGSLTLDWYHNGSNAICSGSYINGVGALTPDEYLVSPQVTLGSGSTFSFWAAATDASYPADHFGVFVSDNGTSGWTMVNEWTLSAKAYEMNGGRESRDGNGAKLGTWNQFTVDLSAHAGQKYIAIRHFNCNDQYIMCVDDMELTAGAKNDRVAIHYKVKLDGVMVDEIDTPYYQHDVEGMEEGSEHVTSVAPVYATGMGDWVDYTWTYVSCENFDGVTAMDAELNGDNVNITWTMPTGTGPEPPTPGTGEWYYYGGDDIATAIGDGGPFYWAVMFPAGSYEGNTLTKVANYGTGYEEFTGTITIYNDGTTAPSTPVGTMNITMPNTSDLVEFEFPTPVTIDPTKNLWVVIYNASSDTYVASACQSGAENSQWVSEDGSTWFTLAEAASSLANYSWMIRAYIAEGAKGEVHEISVPTNTTTHVGQLAMAPVVKRDAWDLVASFSGTSAGQQAVATDGNYIYTASWQDTPTGGNTFYQYDMSGNFIEGFDITGATGIRDLTTDGEYFYGTSGGAQIFILDFTNRTLVGTINCSGLTSRHISYDPERDGFWSGNWSTLALYSRTGALLQSGPAPTSAYGSAYYKDADNVEHLYMFCQPNSDAKVYDYNIATNTISGPIFDFSVTPGFDSAIAGGCFIGSYQGKTCWFGNAQQSPNLIGIYELDNNGTGPTPPVPGLEGILGAYVFRNGELISGEIPLTTTSFVDENAPEGENEYCVRVVYGGELDSTYFAMSCPVCETVTIGDVPCDPVTNTNGYYLNYNQQEGLVVEWDDPEGATQIKLYADGDYLGAVTATGAHHAIFISFDGPAPAGTYTIGLVAVHPDCESEMVEVPIYYDEVGDNDIVNAIYPNPTSDNVTIEAQGMKHITVANALGQVVYDADVEGDMIQLSLGQFKSGLYMVRVNTENGVSVKRVTVVK